MNKAIVFEGTTEGRPVIRASMDDDMRSAVLQRVIENWSLPLPLPSVSPDVLDKLTIEQDDALSEAVQPHLDAIRGRGAPTEGNDVPLDDTAS